MTPAIVGVFGAVVALVLIGAQLLVSMDVYATD